ncbi:undecaprenyl pyrophosphate phosphatase [Corynebacterium occultum]|uniref:Undecaprenyl pyrophosphate phosphatase n=1 Tax=Corynebacterium occultum TaxID=2675219 RepID=A0A6B8VZW7_9CORY|nr:phosphatase PAP2 family protein [Corynebacterium occultum]QGU08539.1 undecaprenyl pyrophosphate phosphatase [Corynebacterium occultum]
MTNPEIRVLLEVQEKLYEAPGILPVARGMSFFGEHAAGWLALGAAGAVVDKRRRREWVALGAAAFTSHAASVVIKRVVRRTRPHDPRIRIGVGTPSRLSFPSSHSTSTTAALLSLAYLSSTPLPLAGVPLMMASRMVLGVHYPTDVLGGAALGAATAQVVRKIERRTA